MTFAQGENEKRKYRQPLTGDTVSSSVWSVAPEGPTIGTPVDAFGSTTALIFGVDSGVIYIVTVHIVGASGQEYENSFEIVGE